MEALIAHFTSTTMARLWSRLPRKRDSGETVFPREPPLRMAEHTLVEKRNTGGAMPALHAFLFPRTVLPFAF